MAQNEDFTTLWELQRVDEALRTAKVASDPNQLQARIGPLAERAAARQRRHEAVEKELAVLRRELARAESELKHCEAEAAGIEQRLYSGSVQNPKELDQMQQKVAALKRQASQMADKILGTYDTLDQKSAEVERRAALRQESEAALRDERAAGEGEAAAAQAQLGPLAAERERLRQALNAAWLERYDRFAKSLAKPVARIEGGNCTACRVAVVGTPRRDALAVCEQCGRLLIPTS